MQPPIHIKTNQHFVVTAVPKAGNEPGSIVPGTIPTWTSNIPSVVTIAPAVDGLSAVVTSADTLGTVDVTVHGNAIPFGPEFTSTFEVIVDPNPADSFLFQFGTVSNNS